MEAIENEVVRRVAVSSIARLDVCCIGKRTAARKGKKGGDHEEGEKYLEALLKIIAGVGEDKSSMGSQM